MPRHIRNLVSAFVLVALLPLLATGCADPIGVDYDAAATETLERGGLGSNG